jgi:3-hydroxybutyryl-CoA dehydratase
MSATYPRHRLTDFSEGQSRRITFSLSEEDLSAFILASGDNHPLHTDSEFALERGFRGKLLHGMCIASRCSHFIAREFVGSHGLLVALGLDFRRPAFVGEELQWCAEVFRVATNAGTVEVKWHVADGAGALVQRGTACAWIGSD